MKWYAPVVDDQLTRDETAHITGQRNGLFLPDHPGTGSVSKTAWATAFHRDCRNIECQALIVQIHREEEMQMFLKISK